MTTTKDLAVVVCHGSPTCDLNNLNVGDINDPDFNREPPTGGYPSDTEDVSTVMQILHMLVNDGKLVLLVGHSSGGWVATQVAVPELHAKVRQLEGKPGGIIGLFYFGAFIIPVGESVHSFFQPKDGNIITPPFMRFHKFGVDGLGTIVDAPRFMFNDLDADTASKWASTLTASPIMTTKLTNDPYSALPCAYVVLENDLTLPKAYQEGMVSLQSQSSKPFTVYYAPAGHSPHLSWTSGLVEKVREFAGKVQG
ncbi:hypothetical protein EYZ11_010215 [Aspergillus tanneri]|uniref:AB hydrolase-1 domain-containing protein n=1 Tax=Aspergillus tanneri TaxID=1220188 RepID=A0A4S3J5V4_9EURO|nr:hypothetical protein EYZ11_010215 [Aspergillus tanneri]